MQFHFAIRKTKKKKEKGSRDWGSSLGRRIVKSKARRRDVEEGLEVGCERETRLTGGGGGSGSNSFCFFPIQFPWALVREIFNKKVDISFGALLLSFFSLPSYFIASAGKLKRSSPFLVNSEIIVPLALKKIQRCFHSVLFWTLI